jgi:hypothetical protein
MVSPVKPPAHHCRVQVIFCIGRADVLRSSVKIREVLLQKMYCDLFEHRPYKTYAKLKVYSLPDEMQRLN